ncbi:hypothetical protein [Nocardia niigatensis]
MTAELHNHSSQPPHPQREQPDHAEKKAEFENPPVPLWTWPAVTLACFLSGIALILMIFLVASGFDPRISGLVAVLLIAGIIACVIPSHGRASLLQRLAAALAAFGGGKGGN